MTRFDFSPYRRTTVGFDRLFDLLENQHRSGNGDNYPPFNISRISDDSYRVVLAVAGFKENDIEITAQQNLLTINGRKPNDDDQKCEFLHLGIANRNFERKFELADFVRVANATLIDGLLTIDLVREIPEAMKPKKIAISNASATEAPKLSSVQSEEEAA
ncbi:Hsp20 family protein [Parasphingorhabdus sp. DH2-15]|uniref:Hsp20 family protein n=1 Tax=Parasphingorhabdus sp. DH2-15 TaxID=3444112 RepID=UPI003F688F60